jgi:hypothetical protein
MIIDTEDEIQITAENAAQVMDSLVAAALG